MIISDLNLLETVEAADVVGGGGYAPTKNVDLVTSLKQNYDVNIDIKGIKNIISNIKSDVKVSGNSSITVFDNTALGNNTYTESNVTNTVIGGKLSESAGTLTAAAK